MTPSLQIDLPDWLTEFAASAPSRVTGLEERMRLAVELARRNVEAGTGGPFGAVVFDPGDGELVSCGVNLVLSCGLSIAHAEVVAISLAQRVTGQVDLGTPVKYQLVTSAEPCWMCLGAVHWSGLTDLICGARDADVRQIGFDEGHKPGDWMQLLAEYGIAAQTGILREEAISVLKQYQEQGGAIYNPGRTGAGER